MNICVKELGYAMIIVLGQMSYGSIVCYPSPAGKGIRERHHLASDATSFSFYNSISCLFAILGSFVTMGLYKLLHNSRKKTLFIIACLGVCCWLLNCLTKVHIGAGIAMRALIGVVLGCFSTVDPVYLVEIAPEGTSGFFGSLSQFGVCLGQVFFDFIGPSLTYMELNYVGAALDGLLALLCIIMIESPVVEAMNKNLANEDENKKKESVFKKKYAYGLVCGVLMMFFQQFCGINAILTNLADIMSRSGLDLDGNYQGGIATLAQIVAVFVGASIVDKIGRRITWIISCSFIVVFLLIFALNEKYNWSNILPLVCIFIYQFGFGLGLGPIPWFIIPELFNAVRSFCIKEPKKGDEVDETEEKLTEKKENAESGYNDV